MTKLNILLDLDQTLISAEAVEEIDVKIHKGKMKSFKWHNMDNIYYVFERPNLQEFLDYVFENFNVSVWTAASKDYALFIIENVIINKKPNRKIDYFFFNYHVDISEKVSKKKCTKDISILKEYFDVPYCLKDTFILDDYDNVFKLQKDNCIWAKPFEFMKDNCVSDNFFSRLLESLKKLSKNGIKMVPTINTELKK